MAIILPANTLASGGYEVANSCRFNFADSVTLKRTPSSASNRKTWTWSGWVKRSKLGSIQVLFNARIGNFPENMYFDGDDKFRYHHDIAGADYKLISSMLFRDVSAWYHIVIAKDTTDSTEANRVKVYVNGTQITMNESALGYPAQDYEGAVNDDEEHNIGEWCTDAGCNSNFIGGYLAEITFIDGLQLAATSFGEFDEDSPTIWKPKDVSGLTFGTNGFYLDFEDSGDLGDDESGNGNDFTEANLAATDQATDTPTNNFATFNPLYTPDPGNLSTFSEGNLRIVSNSSSQKESGISTIGPSNGKWYAEFKLIAEASGESTCGVLYNSGTNTTYGLHGTYGYSVASNGDSFDAGASQGATNWSNTYTTNDIISVALDLDNNRITFAKNGSWTDGSGNWDESSPIAYFSLVASQDYFIGAGDKSTSQSSTWDANYGNPPYANSSSVADANGYGAFEYAPPSGYLALCTKNLGSDGG